MLAVAYFLLGLGLILYFSEKLVEGTVGTSLGFGLSAFIISVVFIGFDPENLALGSVASAEGVAGIAIGTIIGSAMVAIAFAFGITALIAPMKFQRIPKRILLVPVAAFLLFVLLSYDGMLGRLDGGLLLGAFVLGILYLYWLSRSGIDIKATGEVAEVLEKERPPSRWKSLGWLVISLAAIILGSEMLISGSETLIAYFDLTDTLFGMTVLALLVSIEELARELPAALKGRPDISAGNVIGSILAFFLFNAGIIALIQPVPINEQILHFYLPLCGITILVLSAFMLNSRIGRWAGLVLVLLYLFFFAGGYYEIILY